MGKTIEQTIRLKTEVQAQNVEKVVSDIEKAFKGININIDDTQLAPTFKRLKKAIEEVKKENDIELDLSKTGKVDKVLGTYRELAYQLNQIGVEIKDIQSLSDKDLISLFGSQQLKNSQQAIDLIDEAIQKTKEYAKTQKDLEKQISDATNKKKKLEVGKSEFSQLAQKTKNYATKYQINENAKRSTVEDRLNKAKNAKATLYQQEGPLDTEEIKKQEQELDNLISILERAVSLFDENGIESNNFNHALEKTTSHIEKLSDKLKEVTNGDFSELSKELKKLGFNIDPNDLKDLDKLKNSISKLSDQQLKDLKNGVQELSPVFQELINAEQLTRQENDKLAESSAKVMDQLQKSEAIKSTISRFVGLAGAAQVLRRSLRDAYQTVSDLDKSITEQAVVTPQTVAEIWEKLPEMTQAADKLGVAIKDVYDAQTLYYQQGLNDAQVTDLTTSTLKMARIASLDAAEATDRMTNALRGFNMELNDTSAERVADVYSELAAVSATDVNELSVAMTKTASIAASANMSFENTTSYLAQMLETTRESAETAGTALKTVIGRFTEVKELYSTGQLQGTDEEGEAIDVNKVSAALRTAGIDMNKFFTGEVGLDEIFNELAEKWDDLTIVQQRYIATQAAGSRQQSRFIAMLGDYNRLTELQSYAYNAAGASEEQYEKTLDSLESKLNKLKDAWDTFTTGILQNDLVKNLVDIATGFLKVVNSVSTLFGAIDNQSGLAALNKLAMIFATFKGGKALVDFSFGDEKTSTLITDLLNGKIGDFFKDAKKDKSEFKKEEKSIKETTKEGTTEGAIEAQPALEKVYEDASREGTKKGIEEASGESKNPLNKDISEIDESNVEKQAEELGEKIEETIEDSPISTEIKIDSQEIENTAEEITDTFADLKPEGPGVDIENITPKIVGDTFADIKELSDIEDYKKPLEDFANASETAAEVSEKSGSKISSFFSKAGDGAKGAAGKVGTFAKKYSGYLAIIIAAVTATNAVFDFYDNHFTEEAKYKEAQNEVNKLADAYQEANNNYLDMASSFESYQSAINATNMLVEGTLEYNEALLKANEQATELIEKYGLIAGQDYTINDKGQIEINSDSIYQKQANELQRANELQATKTLSQQDANWQKLSADMEAAAKEMNNFGDDLGEIGKRIGEGILAGGATGAGIGLVAGSIAPVIGNAIGVGTGAAVGAATGIVVAAWDSIENGLSSKGEVEAIEKLINSTEGNGEQQAKLAEAFNEYTNNGSVVKLTNIMNDLGITDESLIKEIAQNSESIKELINSNNNLAMAQLASNKLAFEQFNAQNKAFQDSINKDYVATMGASYLNEESSKYQQFKNDIEGKSKKERNKAYTKLLYGDDTEYVRRNLFGKFVYKDSEGNKQKVSWSDSKRKNIDKTLTNTYALEQASANMSEWETQAKQINQDLKNIGIQGKTAAEDKETYQDKRNAISASMAQVRTGASDVVDFSSLTRAEYNKLKDKSYTGPSDMKEAWNKGLENYEQARKDKNIAASKEFGANWENLQAERQQSVITESGMSTEDFEDFATGLADQYGLAADEAERLATRQLELSNATFNLKTAFEENKDAITEGTEALKNGEQASASYYSAMGKIKRISQDLLGIDMGDEWYKDAKNLELLEKAANGDEKALKDLQIQAAKKIVVDMDLPEDKAAWFNSWIEEMQNTDIQIGATLDDSGYIDTLNEMIKAGEITAEQASAYLSSIGYDPVIDTVKVPQSSKTEYSVSGNLGLGIGPKIPVEGSYTVTQDSLVEVPVINGEKTTFAGSKTTPTPKSSGGSSSSSGGSGSTPSWDNNFDWLENLLQEIEANTREMTQLQADMKDMQENPKDFTVQDFAKNIEAQMQNLANKQVLNQSLVENRRKEIDEVIKKFPELKPYVQYNEKGYAQIDYDAIEGLDTSDNEELGNLLESVVSQLQSAADGMNNGLEELEQIDDQARELENSLRDATISFKNSIRDALRNYYAMQLNEEKAMSDAIKDANSELISSLNSALDKDRQARENAKTEQDITDKQQRLAYLQMDTSGANQAEIMSLQKDISNAQEDYTDSLIDQKINELQAQNDEASAQRDKQIEIAQDALDWAYETGEITKQAEQLIIDNIDPNTAQIADGSMLQTVLQAEAGWTAMADEEKAKWVDDWQSQSLTALGYEEYMNKFANKDDAFTVNDDLLTKAMNTYNSQIATELGSIKTSIERIKSEGSGGSGGTGGTGGLGGTGGTGSGTSKFSKGQTVTWTNGLANNQRTGSATISSVSQNKDGSYSYGLSNGTTVSEKDLQTSGVSVNGNSTAQAKYYKLTSNGASASVGKTLQSANVYLDSQGKKTGGLFKYQKSGSGFKNITKNGMNTTQSINNASNWTFDDYSNGYLHIKHNTGEKSEFWTPIDKLWYKYKQGGLADFTGPAWLDGTKSKPEMVLNATDTENFIALKDILGQFMNSRSQSQSQPKEMINNFTINVDEIASDYDVDKLVKRVKEDLYEIGSYRNVTNAKRLR